MAAGSYNGSSIKDFLNKLNDYDSVAQQHLFKCVFKPGRNFPQDSDPFSDIEFFVSEISLPGLTLQQSEQIYWNGQVAEIPYVWDYDRDFSMTILNDGQGKLYHRFFSFISGASTLLCVFHSKACSW